MLISTILLCDIILYYFYYCSYICLTFFLYVYGPCVCNKDILLLLLLNTSFFFFYPLNQCTNIVYYIIFLVKISSVP